MSSILKALVLMIFVHGANAVPSHSHQSIVAAVESYFNELLAGGGDEVSVKVGKIDSRLRLKACEIPLNVSLPATSRRIGGVTVKVSCEGESPWAIYIQSEVEQFGSVMVARRNLQRGDTITQEDIEQRRVSLGRVRGGYITKRENILGWEVKRNIPIGKIVSPNSIRRQLLVTKGDIVVIIAKNAKFEVKMSGIAKSSGAKGDTVQVINQSSKKVVEGVVIGPGVVQVPM